MTKKTSWLDNCAVSNNKINQESEHSIHFGLPNTAIRIHPDDEGAWYNVLPTKKGWWLVDNEIAEYDFGDDIKIRPAKLYLCITPEGGLNILPVTIPIDGDAKSWYKGWMKIIDAAKKGWGAIRKNEGKYCHEFDAVTDCPKPLWPDMGIKECLLIVMKDRYIDSVDHPILTQKKRNVRSFYEIEEG